MAGAKKRSGKPKASSKRKMVEASSSEESDSSGSRAPEAKKAAKPSPKGRKRRKVSENTVTEDGGDGEPVKRRSAATRAYFEKVMRFPTATARNPRATASPPVGKDTRAATSVLTLPESVSQLGSEILPITYPVAGTLSQRVASFLSSPARLTEHFLLQPFVAVPSIQHQHLPSSPLPAEHYTAIQHVNAPHVVPILQAQMAVASAYKATENPNDPIGLVARVLLRKALVAVLQGAAGLANQDPVVKREK
ncbi:hypothetical protein DIPPA_11545 [Diplonema papillatum]|nr:hypothetical protein DIPPA_15667 [Diplonema papillatum]KAJ9450780.1 hypothetical protein DIPPA_11545 [Diplonema papillatum]|eukprot:gene16267-24928_t